MSEILSSLFLAVTVVAHEPGYTTSLANHLKRWLGSESVPAQVVTPAQMPSALAKERLAFLVGFANPSSSEIAALQAFRARGDDGRKASRVSRGGVSWRMEPHGLLLEDTRGPARLHTADLDGA